MFGFLAWLQPPSKFSLLTPSDSTDISSIATKGLYVAATGAVYVQGAGDTTIIALGSQAAGTFIPGHFSRVGASTVATVVACS